MQIKGFMDQITPSAENISTFYKASALEIQTQQSAWLAANPAWLELEAGWIQSLLLRRCHNWQRLLAADFGVVGTLAPAP